MFKKILVPIDGSPNSYHGFKFSAEIAEKFDAEITMIHIVEKPIYAYESPEEMPGAPPSGILDDIEKQAQKLFTDRKLELIQKKVRAKTIMKRGNPPVEILKASKGFDLIVMGSKGCGRLRRILLGSVANSVVQQSKVPVLVVRPE